METMQIMHGISLIEICSVTPLLCNEYVSIKIYKKERKKGEKKRNVTYEE
jgi:hypothetical protein